MKNYFKIVVLLTICTLITSCDLIFGSKKRDRGGNTNSSQNTEVSAPNATTSSEVNESEKASTTDVLAEHPIVNVYLENSGSMNGYVDSGRTSFQVDVFNYLTHIKHSGIPSEMNLNFINSQIINKGCVIDDFINRLTPTSFRSSGGTTATTDLADIFKRILERTNDNTVSIFISDCIFSPGNIKDPQAFLMGQQVGITDCVCQYIEDNSELAMLVYQLYSDYNGWYYDYQNRKSQYKGQRPYYIWVIGHPINVAQLKIAVPNERFIGNGVENTWCAHNLQITNIPYAISPIAVKGSFEQPSNHAITRIKNENGQFAFRIIANMRDVQLLVGDDYLLDDQNYSRLINKEDNDQWYINIEKNSNPQTDATHNITLRSQGNIPRGNLSVIIRCKSPRWAYDLTDLDDSQLTNDNCMKTYGLKYIFDGIEQAFIAKSSGIYAKMDINIK